MGFSFLPSPVLNLLSYQVILKVGIMRGGVGITVPVLFDAQRAMQIVGLQRDFCPSPLCKCQAGAGIED